MMRPFEVFTLTACLLAFLVLAIPQLRWTEWAQYLVLIALLVTIVQLIVERPRWQMTPAYALSGIFCLALLLMQRPPGLMEPYFSSKIAQKVLVSSGLVSLLVASALPIIFPVFGFPSPGGDYPIGTLTFHWSDADRKSHFGVDLNNQHELMVQIWYPAEEVASPVYEPYVRDPAIFASLARLLHLPTPLFSHLKFVTTHAMQAAPVANKEPGYPVLLFLSGRGGYRQSNMFQVEELVSHGYIVVAIDQPYVASGVLFPDGRLITMDPRLYDPDNPGHAAFLDEVLPFIAQDVSFILDQLVSLNQADPNNILTGRLDLQQAGIFGVSLGGIVASEACRLEARLHACLILDAFMPANVVESGLPAPTMWISRDAETMRQEGWAEADIDETQSTMHAVFSSLPVEGYLLSVPGLFHTDFSDAPLFTPLSSMMRLSGSHTVRRSHNIINAYTLAFFERHLRNRADTLLDSPSEQFPEAYLEIHIP
ncbi:MAG: hypothetical protein KDE09_18330 [Anaerolineales bacterium]|nr:hypothetical protein [Anaerolineales bacterium]